MKCDKSFARDLTIRAKLALLDGDTAQADRLRDILLQRYSASYAMKFIRSIDSYRKRMAEKKKAHRAA